MKRVIAGFLLGPLIVPVFFIVFSLFLSDENSSLLMVVGGVATAVAYALTFFIGIPAYWFFKRRGLLSFSTMFQTSFIAGAAIISITTLSNALFGQQTHYAHILTYAAVVGASFGIYWLLEHYKLTHYRKRIFITLIIAGLGIPTLFIEPHMAVNYACLIVILGLFGGMVGSAIWYIGFRQNPYAARI